MSKHSAGWLLLRALGIPDGLQITKAVATIEVGCVTTIDCRLLAKVDMNSKEVGDVWRRFELVEKVEPNDPEAP